jgi:hypothetical protein
MLLGNLTSNIVDTKKTFNTIYVLGSRLQFPSLLKIPIDVQPYVSTNIGYPKL